MKCVNRWSLVPSQCQYGSPIWGAVKKETIQCKKPICATAQLWKQFSGILAELKDSMTKEQQSSPPSRLLTRCALHCTSLLHFALLCSDFSALAKYLQCFRSSQGKHTLPSLVERENASSEPQSSSDLYRHKSLLLIPHWSSFMPVKTPNSHSFIGPKWTCSDWWPMS